MWSLLGDGGRAPSLGGLAVDGGPVPLGSSAAREPTQIPREVWARWEPLDATNIS